ncbi:response regulator transcription factor [Clostridium intestinale]|uniref:Stage 0 sporulation protein A homolog n=1 Tax=Clostridium intestinale DSM 6191 TaxID=1121320 RepID=A0A1M6E9J6_9CLOT|nr:response regulator transcription factor [Clostridium intestinale]SHI81958.1 DNA-binding response regulator, OmpR family, contains REC and winged-helix (wHTH) domain [Clostridium intestinale DSM 6191]
MREKIIVVEDEFYINDILTTALEEEKFQVLSLFNGESLKENLMDFAPDIVLLDVNLPDINGFELCKYINKELSIPIILITARNDVVDKVLGLELGAHDYITKPFHIKEVIARIRVALRSTTKYSSIFTNDLSNQPVAISPVLKVDFDGRIILKNNEEIKLNPKEFEILSLLSKNRNKIFTRDALLNTIWGYEYFGEDRTVDVHIRRLRAKIDTPDFSHIETVFGVGYVMR